ncbi:DUF6318 family protein [Actinomyces oricola]|uniref:DUF6318 family protein n=1 Tax=Actinomyces oricola TaxID=206043 RepID=UPI000FFF1784|nr:DUF6318 family protein [Actinomyces oricola]
MAPRPWPRSPRTFRDRREDNPDTGCDSRGAPRYWLRRAGAVLLALSVSALGALACSAGQSAGSGTATFTAIAGTTTATMSEAEASASVQASRDTAMGPELAALRQAALAMELPTKSSNMDNNDADGAVNSAYYFIELYRYAYVTGDTTEFAAMSEDDCIFCNSVITNVTEMHADGGWADPWEQDIPTADYYPPPEGGEYSKVELTASMGEHVSHSGDGTENRSPATPYYILSLIMRYVDGRWIVTEGVVKETS